MWTCGWWVIAEPQLCSTEVMPIRAPKCFGSAAIGGQLFDLDGTKFRQNPGIKNVPCALHSCRRFLSRYFAEVVLDGVRDCIRAVAKSTLRNLSLAVGPTLCGLLRLPIVENGYAVGLKRVIGGSDRLRRVNTTAAVAARDP
jgi:hypothetical protein